jgi:hypothetical protein
VAGGVGKGVGGEGREQAFGAVAAVGDGRGADDAPACGEAGGGCTLAEVAWCELRQHSDRHAPRRRQLTNGCVGAAAAAGRALEGGQHNMGDE